MTDKTTAQVFTDQAGRSLGRADVEFLAERNMAGSSPAGTIDNDYVLLEWATDVNGEFSARQMGHYGMAFLPIGTRGATRDDVR